MGQLETDGAVVERKNLYVAESIHSRLKVLAARRKTTITQLVEDLVLPALESLETEAEAGVNGATKA